MSDDRKPKGKFQKGDAVRCSDTGCNGVVESISKSGKPIVKFLDGSIGPCVAAERLKN